jgi:hypothetical protein
MTTPYSAANSMSGYLYQVRYALLFLLQKMEHEPDGVISLETRDDIVFEKNGDARELIQLKHTIKATADLSNRSSDLWKTLRIWSEDVVSNPSSSPRFILVTSGAVSSGSIAEMLKAGQTRSVVDAGAELDKIVRSFKKADANADYYSAYKNLTVEQRTKVIERITILDSVADVVDISKEIDGRLRISCREEHLSSMAQSVEGWWFRRSVLALQGTGAQRKIHSREVSSAINDARDRLMPDNLPVDFAKELNLTASDVPENERRFIKQLELITLSDVRIRSAISDYHRAFHQRHKWVTDRLIVNMQLSDYEERLFREWQELYQSMVEDGIPPDDDACAKRGRQLFNDVQRLDLNIRDRFSEAFLMRGSYHMLANREQPPLGWHPKFVEKLQELAARAVGAKS